MAEVHNDNLVIRPAEPGDAAGITAIYAPFVTGTTVSFEVTPPDADEMRRRITASIEDFPWLVCEQDGEVYGYAYASKHRSREAYQWCAECSAYVDESVRRRGVGRALYGSLFALLEAQGYRNVYAGIALPNDTSEMFHAALGFVRVGVYERIGYKFGAWHDVAWWALRLDDSDTPPQPPVAFGELRRRETLDRHLVHPT